MKKFFLTAFVLIFSFAAVQAQVFQKGDIVVNAGIGLGTYHGSMVIPPIAASAEYGVVDNLFDENSSIGVGAYAGFATTRYYPRTEPLSYGMLGARGNFHYQFVDKLDTYAGIMLGVYLGGIYSSSYGYGHYSPFAYSTYLGARYYFTEKIAAFGEIGYGIAVLQLGVSFKL